MREYNYQATDASIEVLRCLKAPWLTAILTSRSLLVTTAEADVIRLSAERADVEPLLEVTRLRADRVPPDDGNQEAGDPIDVGDLTLGRNDVVLFTGETWAEPPAHGSNGTGASAAQTLQMSGRAGQRPPTAAAVCTTTDGIVVAASTGEGILIRLGVRPMTIEIVTERMAIGRFLVQRGYTAD
jgi:hypothetical protein